MFVAFKHSVLFCPAQRGGGNVKNTVDCKVSGKENYKRNVNENSVCT